MLTLKHKPIEANEAPKIQNINNEIQNTQSQ